MKYSPYFRVFLRALLTLSAVLFVDRCCGQAGNCSYQYCSHTSMLVCAPGGLVRLQCVVYNAANIIQVKWYHSLNGNPMELNIATGERYIVNEYDVPLSPTFENCTGDDWRSYQLDFIYTETDSGSYWCQIVIAGNIHLDLSEPWMVDTLSFPSMICGYVGVTDLKCVGQPTVTPSLSVSHVLAQDYSTSAVGTTTKPFVLTTTMIHSPVETPSIPSHSTAPPSTTPPLTTPSSTTLPAGCTVGGTSCFVYLAAGFGVLAIIVVLLVVVVIVFIRISVRRGKKKGKANSEPQATLSEGEYCLPELGDEVQKREESKIGAYQALDLDNMDYTSMYSKIQESFKQQTPTVERGDHVYAVIDSSRVEPPSQYSKLK